MRLLATVTVAAALALLPATPAAAATATAHTATAHTAKPRHRDAAHIRASRPPLSSETPIPVALSNVPPAGRRLSADRVLAIANALPKMRALRAEYHGSFGDVYLKGAFQWQVSYFSRDGKKEIGLVIIDDLSGRVRRTVDRLPGRVDDGARLSRRVRQARQRAVHLAAAVPPVHPAVLRLPPALLAAAPRPARAAVLLGLARLLQPRPHLRLGSARLPAAAVSAGAHARAAPARAGMGSPPTGRPTRSFTAAAAPARANALACARRDLPARLPHHAQRHRLERHRRRLRRRDRGAADRRRQAPVRWLSGGQRTRRHLWPGQLRGVRSLRADLRLERHLG